MSKISGLSLRQNFSWNLIGSLVYSASQFFILILIAKLGSPMMVGLYSIGLAISAPIIMLTNLQLRQIQATDTTNYYTFNDYFGLRIVTGGVALILMFMIVSLSGYDLNKIIIILLVGLTKIVDSYSDVIHGQLQQRERMDYIGISRVIKGIVTVFVMGISLFITRDLITSLILLNISWFFIFFLYDMNRIKLFLKSVIPSFNFIKIKKLVILAFPLGIVLMVSSLNTNLPRIILEQFQGAEALGYFAAISYLLVVGNTFIQSVGQAFAPRLAKLYSDNLYLRFKKIILLLTILGILVGLLGTLIAVIIGEEVLTIIYDGSYAEYNYLFILIMISSVFLYASSFSGYGLTAMRLFKIQPVISILSLLITLISSLILIPIYNLTGAAYTIIIGSISQVAFKLIVIYLNLNRRRTNMLE